MRDAELTAAVRRVHEANFGVYGVRKVCAALAREGVHAGRDRIARIMREQGLEGVRRGRRTTTTHPARTVTAGDLVERCFAVPTPDRLWVADITYVPLATGGFCYAAFVTDAYPAGSSAGRWRGRSRPTFKQYGGPCLCAWLGWSC